MMDDNAKEKSEILRMPGRLKIIRRQSAFVDANQRWDRDVVSVVMQEVRVGTKKRV